MATLTGNSENNTLTGTSSADTISGLAGNDILDGGNGNDTLDGGKGADKLIGGDGTDTASYANSDAAVQIDITKSINAGGDAEGDTFSSIEKIAGSAHADTFTSNSEITFAGGRGNDTYIVSSEAVVISEVDGEGTDIVKTTTDAYTLSNYVETLEYTGTRNFTGTGSAQNNTITGGTGNDTLIGKGGADTLNGGEGSDTASYAGSYAVTVNLKANTGSGGDAEGDKFTNIENLYGSYYADTLTGNDGANILDGQNNHDTLDGGKGADKLIGGDGTDTASYANSDAAVQIDITKSINAGGDAEGDTFSSIEKIAGSAHADTFTSNSEITFAGGRGNDTYIVSS
ncbi:calcium-binding protein, partial [Agrobacterium vitis]